MLEGIGLILVGALALVSLVSLFLVVGVLFPGIINRSAVSLETSNKRAFWLGFINTLVAAILIGVFVWLGENVAEFLFLLAILILVFYVPAALFGLIALGRMIGEKLFGNHSGIRQQIYGSGVMILAALFPFLGWYVLFPFLLIQGFGAFLVAVVFKKNEFPEPIASE
jgi:hypothetical protein